MDRKLAITVLSAILFLATGAKSLAQSYFYFENKLPLSGDSSLTYYTFLTLHGNGRAFARIRYIEPISQENRLVEVSLIDSADSRGGIDNEQQYLIVENEPLPVEGTDISGFRLPRFVFKKQTEGQDVFYMPEAISYKFADGSWRSSEMQAMQQKSFQDLRRERELVQVFFSESDNFYGYLFNLRASPRAPDKRKERFHLIVVANTLDSAIGVTTRKDAANIVTLFTKVAEDMNMNIAISRIMDNTFGKKSVELALAQVRPSPVDIVVFYYSGHGFRYSNDVSVYPRISLRIGQRENLDNNNLGMEAIYKILLKKKAKVTLVLSDCCNDDIGALAPWGPTIMRGRAPTGERPPALNVSTCKRLFFPEKPMSILIGSADKNQLAVGNPSLGGYFTNSFAVELRNTLYGTGGNATWLTILANTRKQASWRSLAAECGQNRCIQSARFAVSPQF